MFVRIDCIERQTASETFGEGIQTLVIESAVRTYHGPAKPHLVNEDVYLGIEHHDQT